MFVGDDAGDQQDADADREAKLAPDSNLPVEFDAPHIGCGRDGGVLVKGGLTND